MSESGRQDLLGSDLLTSYTSSMSLSASSSTTSHPPTRSTSPSSSFFHEPIEPPEPLITTNPQNLYELLERAARLSPMKGTLYLEGEDEHNGRTIEDFQSYPELLKEARLKSLALRMRLRGMTQKSDGNNIRIVVLHLDGYKESLVWFWACVAAGVVPVMSLPLKGDAKNHAKYINHIRELFDEPLIITNANLVRHFKQFNNTTIRLYTTAQVEEFRNAVHIDNNMDYAFPGAYREPKNVACIMLTSGSTGLSKGVKIKHGMVLKSVAGKSEKHATDNRDIFLSWTETSHVANLIEVHIQALFLGAGQIHVESDRIISDPSVLFDLVDKYRVSYTFAPNFLLTSLVKALERVQKLHVDDKHVDNLEDLEIGEVLHYLNNKDDQQLKTGYSAPYSRHQALTNIGDNLTKPWDLSCLRALISGGESNVVATCEKLTDMLQLYGAPCAFIRPGFGMTETCAGSIYSLSCPSTDLEQGLEFANLGKPIDDIEVRVTSKGKKVYPGEAGRLELRGSVIFDGYHNDVVATAESFTTDGWFITGDNARLDENGNLHIIGRQKDVICIYGINHHPQAIETTIESENIKGIKPSWVAVFGYRPAVGGKVVETEHMVVVYVPSYAPEDVKARVDTLTAISKTVVLFTGIRPSKVIPLPEAILNKSILGKLSRSQIRGVFRQGGYHQYEKFDETMIAGYQNSGRRPGSTTERMIIKSYREIFSAGISDLGAEANLFELGVSSGDLLRLRVEIQKNLGVTKFPISHFFTYPTIRELAAALEDVDKAAKYTPIVVLRPKTPEMIKVPLFLFHPGMGEVLAFMNLSRYIDDRPIYAFRARGFDGEDFFSTFEEAIQVYMKALKEHQPEGPYALAGYSWGAMIAFEVAKRLIKQGDEVKMLVTFDMSPFCKVRARSYDWHECLVSVAFFHGIMDESFAYANLPEFRKLTREQLLDFVLDNAPPGKLAEMGMDRTKLERWGDLALNLKRIVWDYDPVGFAPHMDVLYTVPLLGVVAAKSTEEWRNDYIGKWDLLVEQPVYHFVDGGHRTMLNPPHVATLQKTLKKIMEKRGV